MQKVILGLITATMFSGVSAQACIGSLNVEERRDIQKEIKSSIERELYGHIIGGLLPVRQSEIIGIRGNCDAVQISRVDNVTYSIPTKRDVQICTATVATQYNKGMIGTEDGIKHIVVRGECESIEQD